ncbi:MAG: M3 family oligoendopeptidase [Armatimonadetes bacterium]|nr:M3 family oligoendopeptidase [Armatimonadota bacterium]
MAVAPQELESPKVHWDLSALFSGIDDPRIDQSWELAHQRADEVIRKYRGQIESEALSAETLLRAILDVERLSQDADKAPLYANLLFAVDVSDPKISAFMQKQMEKHSELRVKLMFLELELQATPQETIDKIIDHPSLTPYRHFIERTRAFSPYRLSEKEEILLEETSNVGTRAWVRLFEEVTGNNVYKFQRPGSDEIEELTEQEVLALLREGDRSLRVAAGESFTRGLEEQQRVITFIYNNILADKKLEDRLRKFDYPEASRHLSNELEKEIVDVVSELCAKNYGVVERYYRVKREILGLAELTHVDRYAPLHEAKKQVAWDEGKKIVLDAFSAFNTELADRANEFFEKGWIDAEARAGKGGGAFCSYLTPDTHPVVMVNYLNKMDDVSTLAHELGHGVHASVSRSQTYFNFHGTLPLAELASIFGEMLVFEKLVAGASPEDKLALYAEKIEGTFASVFRQIAMYRFEQACHRARREEGELSSEEFGDLWQSELQAMFGDSVKLGEDHRKWWMYVGHFFFAPFYVYAYAFGELLTLSLYQRAKHEGPEFATRYMDMLRMAGSKSPMELMAYVGVDLRSPEFWQGGIDAIEALVAEFERLWAAAR